MSYNGWAYNDWSYNDQSYNDYPNNECSYGSYSDPYMLEEYSNGETYEEEPFDGTELMDLMQQYSLDQKQASLELIAKLDKMCNNIDNKIGAVWTHVEKLETKIAQNAETQSQLEGATNVEESCDESVISILTILTPNQELCDDIFTNAENEEAVEEITRLLYGSNHKELSNLLLIHESAFDPPSQLEGTCNSTLEIDHFEEISLPCIEKEVSSSLLVVDKCLELPCVSQDKVDYSLVDSTNLEIDFIFPPKAFDPPTQMNINKHHWKYFSFVETCFNKIVNTNFNNQLVLLVWTIVFLLAQFVYCENRRRTKGPLAQPFDSCD